MHLPFSSSIEINDFLKLCRCIVKLDIRVVMGVCESIRLPVCIYVCGCVCVGKVEPLELDTPRLWTLFRLVSSIADTPLMWTRLRSHTVLTCFSNINK